MNRYEVFVKVVESGNFTRAAQELNYTQSAVSQMVHTLEAELSAVLILRGKNGVTLTADGEEYFPYIRSVCNAHRELEEKYREMQGLHSGKVRIGSFTSVSRNWLPGLMKKFKEQYPAVQFELFQGEYTNIGQWIREGRVDFGFVNPDAVNGLEKLPLYQDEMVAVLPKDHFLAEKEAVTLEELAACPNILLDEGELSVPLNAYEKRGLKPDIQYRVYDDYSIMTMVEQGFGVSILYKLVVQNQARSCVIRPIEPAVERTVAVACKNRKTLPAASRVFLNFILESFRVS
ncbi:MAG: LysR family transcriptional regulator [Candidatus Limivivens sp.]|nr:LysR family transcriptional regulator [Candidatus Limivivens sp.]